MSRTARADRRLPLLVGSVALLGLAAIAASLAEVTGGIGAAVAPDSWLWLGAFTLLVAGSLRLRVEVRIRSTRHSETWTDAVVLVGLATMPVPWVVLATAAGTMIARAIAPGRLVKAGFAVAQGSATVLICGLVLSGLASLGRSGTAWELAWLAVTFATMTVVNQLLAVPVIALASRTRVRDRLLANADIWLIAVVGRLLVALVAVVVLERAPQLVYALPLLVLLGHVWHEQWVRAREERRAWQEHARVTDSLNEVELDVVLLRAATGGARLFSAEALEVELWQPLPRRLVRGDPDGVVFDGDPADAPPELVLVNVHESTLHGRPGQPEIGVLRLRFRDRVKLSGREAAMLATYVAALETAIRNATAYGLLRHAAGRG